MRAHAPCSQCQQLCYAVKLAMASLLKSASTRLKVGNASRGGLLCGQLTPLRGRWARFRQAWRYRFAPGEALLLQPVHSVHSWGAGFELQVIFLNSKWRVLACHCLPPNHTLSAPGHAQIALLMPALASTLQPQPGDLLELIGAMPRLG
jgi:hypothetical protein